MAIFRHFLLLCFLVFRVSDKKVCCNAYLTLQQVFFLCLQDFIFRFSAPWIGYLQGGGGGLFSYFLRPPPFFLNKYYQVGFWASCTEIWCHSFWKNFQPSFFQMLFLPHFLTLLVLELHIVKTVGSTALGYSVLYFSCFVFSCIPIRIIFI